MGGCSQLRAVQRDNGVAARATIGGQQAVGGGERLGQAGPEMYLGIVGQGFVGFGHGGGQLGVGAVRAVRP